MQTIADFVNAVESKGEWSVAMADVVMHLILKPTGGRRPIAVLASVVRIWGLARKPVIRQWAARNRKVHDWVAEEDPRKPRRVLKPCTTKQQRNRV